MAGLVGERDDFFIPEATSRFMEDFPLFLSPLPTSNHMRREKKT